jgi:hypothetical protein
MRLVKKARTLKKRISVSGYFPPSACFFSQQRHIFPVTNVWILSQSITRAHPKTGDVYVFTGQPVADFF